VQQQQQQQPAQTNPPIAPLVQQPPPLIPEPQSAHSPASIRPVPSHGKKKRSRKQGGPLHVGSFTSGCVLV
jgi:hypothetical protein